MDLGALKTELQTDALVRGYAGMSDAQVVASLNTLDRTLSRSSMTGREVQAEVVDSEYDLLSDAKKAQFLSLTASDDLDPFGLPANVIKDIFGAGSATLSALGAARTQTISRAVELELGTVTEAGVAAARRRL